MHTHPQSDAGMRGGDAVVTIADIENRSLDSHRWLVNNRIELHASMMDFTQSDWL